MRAVCRHTLFGGNSHHNENTLGKFIRSVTFLTMSKLNVVTEKFSSGSPSTSTWVALITKVSFLSLYVY